MEFFHIILLFTIPGTISLSSDHTNIDFKSVKSWAMKLGSELWNVGNYVTRRKLVEESFSTASLAKVDPKSLADDITKDIESMMNLKVSAVRRIMDIAESLAMNQDDSNEEVKYRNAKNMTSENENNFDNESVVLTPNPHFWNIPVNTSFSSVHVPTNVYDRAKEVISAIKWSEKLDATFISNYEHDPSLSWQYFGSSTGFMRQYPAMAWKFDPVDLYDCRTRSWFIEAATSPKDLVIMVDHSGSMTGQRKEIARHIVNNILDTLGTNDFVNVFNFTNQTNHIVPCFKDKLVQANLFNVRAFKQGMENCDTKDIANVDAALNTAFQLLAEYRNSSEEGYSGARCNQAIMLIADGVPYNYKAIFEQYNWPYDSPVRVFTYLVGKEVADVREIKWMACANRGYYVHLSTMAEVREQVLKYIPVMARPLVLNKSHHPVIWTLVYADISDPKMTDYLWELKQNEEQKEKVLHARKQKRITKEEQDNRYLRVDRDSDIKLHEYKMMTSISMPVFDRHENITRAANLLGVAGTDVPIAEIEKLLNPFKLGVNGYAFIVTNNGYVLTHPDLRPVFKGILKPNYNSVDMAEIELVDENRSAREFSWKLLELRKNIIFQKTGQSVLSTKYHYHDMKRVSTMKRRYIYRPIKNSTFTLVLSIPNNYTHYVKAIEEIHRSNINGEEILSYLGENWSIHPNWVYCKYHYDVEHQFKTPEEEFVHFLERTKKIGWAWKQRNILQTPEHHYIYSNATFGKTDKLDKDSHFCDRDLFLSLVYDAKATSWFQDKIGSTEKENKLEEFSKRFGITVAFMSTRSGLTRWQDVDTERSNASNEEYGHFIDVNNRTIDEIWYKRAVEQYLKDKESFVYSVPFDIRASDKTLVTASHAVYRHVSPNESAPVAVVGYQFHHSALRDLLLNVATCPQGSHTCMSDCASSELDCFIIDNNGFIIVSEDSRHTGMFFGEINGFVMEKLISEGFYKKVHIYDYQAVCFPLRRNGDEGSHAQCLTTPMSQLLSIWRWFLAQLLWTLSNLSSIYSEIIETDEQIAHDEDLGMDVEFEDHKETPIYQTQVKKEIHITDERDMSINRTRPQTCDAEVDLYELQFGKDALYNTSADGCIRPFVVQPIQYSNLILLVIDVESVNKCEIYYPPISVKPTEVSYGNESLTCHKLYISEDLARLRPKDCISRHELEKDVTICGLANQVTVSFFFVALVLSIAIFQH